MKVEFGDRCTRCNRAAMNMIWCERHYKQWLSEWSCNGCGTINGGSANRAREICPKCDTRRGEGK
jgi:hypothetical protein